MPPLDAAAAEKDDWISLPSAASAATPAATETPAAGKDDWITAPAQHWAAPAGGEFGDLSAQASAHPAPQGQVGADVNAVGQGLVSGTGSLIAGAGRIAQAGTGPSASRVLAALDLVDQGKNRDAYQKLSDSERQQVGAYRGSRPEDKQAQRDALQQTISDYDKPNAVTQAGMAVESAAPTLFPVDPANEGIQTGVGRMIGGAGPALAAGAIGGPPGVLASLAVIGSQAYDGAYQDAVSKGVTHEAADDAAGKSALAQAVTMVAPVGRLLQRVPMPLRDGLTATLVNLGQHGVEFGTANALGTFVNNYVAQTYDPDRSLTQGTGQAGLEGVIAGLVIRGAATGVGAARAQPGPGPRAAAVPAVGVSDVMAAPDIDGAIAAAGEAAQAPAGGATDATQPTRTDWGQLFDSGPMGDAGGSHVPTLTLSSGLKVPARFDVAEAGDLIPASGDLQPRDRAGRMASSAQIVDMASNLDPERLHASPGPDQGAPTVNANGVILAGNGRTRAIRQAYALGNADPYRAMVERYGFDTTGMSEPMLIRRIDQQTTPEQDRQIAVESNISAGQRLSGTEQAAIDARSLTPDLLAKYDPLLTGGPTAAGNRDFVRSWVGTLPQSERNSVMSADGSISSDGVRRLQGAMLSMAFGDKGTLSRSLESTDDTTRALTGALTDAAPAWAQLQSEITAGRVPPEMNVAPQLTRAVELVRQAREKGQTAADVLGQSDAFNPIDPVTEAFVRAFYNPLLTRAASRPLVAEVLRRYATEAAKTSTEAGLFGDAQPAVAPADVLATVVAAARKEPSVMPVEDLEAAKASMTGLKPPGLTDVSSTLPTRTRSGGSSAFEADLIRAEDAVLGTAQPAAPSPVRVTAAQVQVRDGVGGVEAQRRATAENAAAAAPVPESVGAAASNVGAMSAGDFAANRRQGEIERLAAEPLLNDRNVYIPNTKLTLAEGTGNPVDATAQAYNRQQTEAMQEHTKVEDHNAGLVAAYYADTANSAQTLLAMERDRAVLAQRNIQRVFGDPLDDRPPADPTPTIDFMQGILNNPRQSARDSVAHTVSSLLKKFYGPDGKLKTDPYALYGIGEHINDLLAGVGDAKTSSAASVLTRELTVIKNSLYADIEGAAPGFAQYRADFERDSRAIDALKLLQDERLNLLSGTTQHITPAKWATFMKGIVTGRADPWDPASSLSEDQMDRLWNITDQLKRATLIDKGKPRGSWTSMMHEMGIRSVGRVVGHIASLATMPGIGNIAIELANAGLKHRDVIKEMNRVLYPDFGPQSGP